MMRVSVLLTVILMMALGDTVQAQQLLIIKKGAVSSRFDQGDDIYFELRDQKQIHHAVIQHIREFYFTTVQGDTIQYQRVALVAFRNDERKRFGMTTAITGVALLGVYGLNSLAFDRQTPAMRGLRFVGILGAGAGTFIYLTADKKVRLNGIRRLKYVSYDSPLYR